MSDEKLIDIQVGGLKCDAEGCDYTDTDAKMEDYEQYVNAPCPKCGAPLLTEEDMAAVKQMHEMADLINGMGPNLELGASDAINLDGGGSSTMVVAGEDGTPQVINRPIHTGVPGRERPVANHLAVVPIARKP